MTTYSQCKCGDLQSWGSGMSPARCCPCEKCGTVPASHPDHHPEPVPHDYYESTVETDAGPMPLSWCRLCNKTKAQIERTPTPRPDPEECRRLREALEALRAVQNGSPLEKYRKAWEAAMQQADGALAGTEPE